MRTLFALLLLTALAAPSRAQPSRLAPPEGVALGGRILTVDTSADDQGYDAAASLAACTDDTADGDCTLREAIEIANASRSFEEIYFDIPGSGVRTIRPLAPLPAITNPNVIIDGYTQPGAQANTSVTGTNAVLLVELDGSLAGPSNGLDLDQSNATVRGLVINQFDGDGISIQGTFNPFGGPPQRPVVEGTYIGTSADGTTPRPNTGRGVVVGQPFARIGTDGDGVDDLAERNVISGNGRDGVEVFRVFSVRVAGNRIGTTAAGTAALPNEGSGIFVQESSDIQVGTNGDGSHDDAEANVIANNRLDGVRGRDAGAFRVSGGPETSASVLGNVIRANGGLGINLVGGEETDAGVTPNDPDDEDRGPNRLQNYPVIESVTPEGTGFTVAFTLDSDEFRATYRIEFFASPTADPSGFGEGARFLGAVRVQADDDGDAAGTFEVTNIVGGEVLTATATIDQNTIDRVVSGAVGGWANYGGTSEFSAAVPVGDADGTDAPAVRFATVQQAVSEGAGAVTLTLVADEAPAVDTDVTVTLVSGDPADLGGFTSRTVTFAAGGPATIDIVVPVTDDAFVEDSETFLFTLSVVARSDGDPGLSVGSSAQTAVVVVDNDGQAVTVTVTPADGDGDGAEDGGLRLFAVPLGGVTAGDVAQASGADTVYVYVAMGGPDGGPGFVSVGDDFVIAAGQPVLVGVAPGADLTFTGSAPTSTVGYPVAALDLSGMAGGGSRVLVAVGNPTGRPIALDGIAVEGGALADVALVFDPTAGSFRPVSLGGLDDDCDGTADCVALGAFDVVILQVDAAADDCDDATCGVTVSVPTGTAGSTATPIADAAFAPTDGETAVVLALRPTAASGTAAPMGDTFAIRFLTGASAGLDRFDGVDLEAPTGATLGGFAPTSGAADADALFAAMSVGPLAAGSPALVPLEVSVPEAGTYELALVGPDNGLVGNRPVVVEVFDGTTSVTVSEGQPFVFTAGEGEDLTGRFAVRVSLGTGVATGTGPAALALSVFPNPTAGRSTVAVTGVTGPARVSVVDALGREVAVLHDGPVASGDARYEVGRLAPGLYVVRLQSADGVATRSLTVAR
ncbi:T9SS type A sorting domain-containing protein [Rubrivirga sp. IMCC43871]|uniref:T9SS type A sorting domain-containing protein n=1 Tax=Rubrivirga sp. IMCC43871 TaxID=3391575 RepID=UPI0039900031